MTAWQVFARNPDMQALSWTLLNFLWQGTLIALVLKCLLAALRRHPANLRYWTSTAALFLMLGMPMLTFWKPPTVPAAIPTSVTVISSVDSSPAVAGTRPEVKFTSAAPSGRTLPDAGTSSAAARIDRWTHAVQARLPDLIPWVPAFWFLGIILAGIQMFGGLLQLNMMRRNARELVPEGDLEYLIRRSGVAGRVRLLESEHVAVPTVIGWFRPAVLLPAAASTDSGDTEALLAHELAHIRRRDYLVNLFQAAVEVLLFFHPAVWWVSAQVRSERECCCDDAAVIICGNLRTYVRALSNAEHHRSASNLAVALSGTPLLNRIRRLTEMKTPQSKLLTNWATGISAFALLSAAAAGSTLLAFVPVQVDAQAAVVLPRGSNPQAATPAPLKTPPVQIAPAKKAPAATPAPVPKASNTPNPATKQSSKTQPVELQAVPADFTGRLQLEQLRETLADLTARYNANHPEILRIKAMIAEKERELAVETRQQQEQGQKITGTILDPTGGVIPGATISILDGETRELLAVAHSGSDGSYEIAPPKPNYYIQFVLPGFQTQVFSSSQLGPNPLTIEMELGQVREVVTVTTVAPPAKENRGLKKEPIRVGGNVVPPKLVQRADPVYPAEARSANVEGGVVVSALIDQEGNVKDAVVLSGHRLLRDAALDCVNQWRYQPALVNGTPWPMRLSITVIFKLQRIE